MNDPRILDQIGVLADATRVRLLIVLDDQELTVSELCSVLQLPQSTVSRHLKVLGDQGWVRRRAEGACRYYRLELEGLGPVERRMWLLVRDAMGDEESTHRDLSRRESVLRERSSRSTRFFSESAAQWDEVRETLYGGRFDLQSLAALAEPGWTIGDLGCGTGRVSAALAPFVERVVAVDASEAMLGGARARLDGYDNVSVRHGQLEQLPIDDGELDLALLVLVLHFLPEPATALREACRTLKPGGRLLIVDMLPHEREELRQQMGHVWLGFAPQEIESRLEQLGFDRVDVRELAADPEAKGPGLFVATGRGFDREAGRASRHDFRPIPKTSSTTRGA